jgi:O-antigen/teichoic acid export membrane protein
MAMIPATIITYFRDWGINSAIVKEIARLKSSGREAEIHDVIFSGMIFELFSGAALSIICFAIAYPLAQFISPQDASQLSVYISIMSLSIFAGAVGAAAGGIFVGYERMKLSSFAQVFSAVVKTALGPLLIVLGFGVLGAVTAATVAILSGAVISIIIAYYAFFRPLRKSKVGKCDVKATLKPMLRFGLPLTFSTIVIGVLPQIFALSMSVYAGQGDVAAGNPFGWMMGNYFTAMNFAVLLTFVSFPVATALFPVFSKLNPEKEPELVKTVFASSVKYTALLLVPATFALIALAAPLVNTLFPQDGIFQSLFVVDAAPKFPYAPIFLGVSVVVNLFVLVGNISLGTFQSGIGQTKQIMKQSALSLVVGLPLAYVMVQFFYSLGGSNAEASAYYAVIGGLIGSLIASLPGMIWGIIWCWKNYKIKADLNVSVRIFTASLIAAVAAYPLISFLRLPYFITLIAGFVVFLLVYLTMAPLFGAVNNMDIENFRAMFSGLGAVSKLLSLPLSFMSKLCRRTIKNKVTQVPIEINQENLNAPS